MRAAIVRVLLWALSRLLPAEDDAVPPPTFTPEPAPVPARWWSTPTPAHVVERQRTLRGEDCRTVRPYVVAEETLQLRALSADHDPYAHRGTYA
ncbi:hypothetical protein [Streptomyces sp. NPDC005953]|uniref:hypothetical protein n=1 Tax=Streptomyces sp. NPDC005953 TaxID=3156719 RepID=UPI0033F49E3C